MHLKNMIRINSDCVQSFQVSPPSGLPFQDPSSKYNSTDSRVILEELNSNSSKSLFSVTNELCPISRVFPKYNHNNKDFNRDCAVPCPSVSINCLPFEDNFLSAALLTQRALCSVLGNINSACAKSSPNMLSCLSFQYHFLSIILSICKALS